MSYQKNNTEYPGSPHDNKPRPTCTNNKWLLVVGFSFVFTAVVVTLLLFSAQTSSNGGIIVGTNSASSVALVETGAYPEFELKHNSKTRGYESATGRLNPDDEVVIHGSTQLWPYIDFNNGGLVYTIEMIKEPFMHAGNFVFYIKMYARGPVGFGTGCGHLRFTREDGEQDTYTVCSSTTKFHYTQLVTDYPHNYPVVVKIDWSNYDFND